MTQFSQRNRLWLTRFLPILTPILTKPDNTLIATKLITSPEALFTSPRSSKTLVKALDRSVSGSSEVVLEVLKKRTSGTSCTTSFASSHDVVSEVIGASASGSSEVVLEVLKKRTSGTSYTTSFASSTQRIEGKLGRLIRCP